MKTQNNLFISLQIEKYKKVLPDFKEKKTQIYTTLILTFIALSFFGIFAISPTLSTIAQLNKKLEDSRFVNAKLEEKIKNLSLLSQQYNLLQEDIKAVETAIPVSSKTPIFIAQIEEIAKLSQVTLLRLNTASVELSNENINLSNANMEFQTFSFFLNIQGSYENINRFISTLINFERITILDSLSLRKNDNIFTLDIAGKAYFKK